MVSYSIFAWIVLQYQGLLRNLSNSSLFVLLQYHTSPPALNNSLSDNIQGVETIFLELDYTIGDLVSI